MRLLRTAVTCLLLSVPAASHAHMLGLKLDHSRTPATASNPVSGSSGVNLSGSYDATEELSFDAGFGLSRPSAAPPSQGGTDKTNGGTVANLSLGTAWFYGDHWFFMAALSGSPKSTSLDSTVVTIQEGKTTKDVDGLLKSDSSALGVLLSTSYSTGGDSDAETEVALTLSGAHLSTTQRLQELDGTDLNKLRDFCAAQGKGSPTCKRLGPALKAASESVNSLGINLMVSETIFQNSEVSLGGTYYLYNRDPNEVGYFTIASAGKTGPLGGRDHSTSFGSGVAIAPLLWSGSLGISHKWSRVRLSLTGGRGQYIDAGGHSNSLTGKVNVKISEAWRVILAGGGQGNVDEAGDTTRSFSGSGTVRFTF